MLKYIFILCMKPLMVFCVFVYGAWIFLYSFFFRCVECSSIFFGCDVLLFAYAEVDLIRFIQEIVQVLLSFNLIKAQQDGYDDTDFLFPFRLLLLYRNLWRYFLKIVYLPTWSTFSTQFDSSSLRPLQKLRFCVSPAFVDETLSKCKTEHY